MKSNRIAWILCYALMLLTTGAFAEGNWKVTVDPIDDTVEVSLVCDDSPFVSPEAEIGMKFEPDMTWWYVWWSERLDDDSSQQNVTIRFGKSKAIDLELWKSKQNVAGYAWEGFLNLLAESDVVAVRTKIGDRTITRTFKTSGFIDALASLRTSHPFLSSRIDEALESGSRSIEEPDQADDATLPEEAS